MRGHVAAKKSKSGTKYYIVVDVQDELTGKRKRKWLTGKDGKGFERKRDAEREMPEVLKRFYGGTLTSKQAESVDNLMTKWLEDKKTAVRPATWKSYEWLVTTHLIPHLGKIKVDKLQPAQVHNLYHNVLTPALSAASVKKLHVILNDALNRAVTWGSIVRNVASTVELPKGKKQKFEVWDADQLNAFLEAANDDAYFIVFELAASTGMRQSEILALRWVDVDFDTKTVSVRQTYTKAESGHQFNDTKSDSSVRSIALFSETVEHLRQHKIKQNAQRMANRKLYQDHGLVAQSNVGTPLNPRNVMRNFYKLLDEVNVPRIRFHDLRHTHATILLKNGVHPKIVQERLGHSSITVTLDTYSHVLPNMQEAVLAGIGTSITGGKANKKPLGR